MSDVGANAAPSGGLRLRLGGFDPDAVARAEAALKSLSANFDAWLADEIAKLKAARARIEAEGLTPETAEGLYMRAHDLKGLGATYQYPIITTIAGLLCKFTDKPEQRFNAPLALVDAHIGAIEAAVAGDIRTDEDPRGAATLAALEKAVQQHLAAG